MDYNLHQFSYDPFYGMFRKLVFWEKTWSWWLVVGITIQNMYIHFYKLVLFDVYFIEDKMKYDLFLLSPSDKTTPQNSPFLFWIMHVLHLTKKG